jgi:hypothetical protein
VSINVVCSPWIIRAPGTHICRQYEFKNLAGAHSEMLFQVWVSAHKASSEHVYEFVRFFLMPRFVHGERLLAAFLGTMDQELDAGFFKVKAILVNGGGNDFSVQAESASDNAHEKCLAVLNTGKPMRFLLNDEQQCLINIPLENDLSYRDVLAEMRGIFTGNRTASTTQVSRGVPAMLDEITNTIVQLKQSMAISYTVILPSLLTISARMLVQDRGLEAALDALAVTLEMAERACRVSSARILSAEQPERPLSHRIESDKAFWGLAHHLHAKGHRVNDIAQTFEAVAVRLAEEKVDKIYAMIIVKQTHDDLKREAL